MQETALKSRPKFLTWLCIASAAAGLSWISMLVALIIFSLKGNIPAGLFPGLAAEYPQAGTWFVAALILLAMLSITGVSMMWHLKKNGFYLYAVSKTLIYFLPVIVIGYNHLTYPGLILTSIVIVLYGIIFSENVKF